MKRIAFFPVLFLVLLTAPSCSQPESVKQVKLTDFYLQSSVLAYESGKELSDPDYRAPVYWFPVKVPSTVLSGLVANGVYPDPYQGLNNMYIPDASDEFNKQYDLEKYSHIPGEPNPWKKPYWYRTVFTIPSADEGRHFQLIFKGINYRADVWVNGIQVADSTDMAGMFAEYSLNISKYIRAGNSNALAVKIYPLDYPGLPAAEQLEALGDFYANGGPTGDIGKNVTMLCSVGWDWMPPVRDRNIGIWQPVFLRISGDVTISRPKLVTDLSSLPDTSVAELSLSLDLVNHGTKEQNGNLIITISPENFSGAAFRVSKPVKIGAEKSVKIDLNSSNTDKFKISKPSLWWPNGYGKPNLYRIRLQYEVEGIMSDDTTFLFGIRKVATKAVNVNGSWRRDFFVNGQRIHITGGAWVPDMMLNRDSLRYDYEFRLCRNSNINLVRIWGGGVTPGDDFWDAADRYGMLVWSDFWITGDTQGEFKGSPDWPLEGEIFKKNVVSTIFRVRNHPSLLVWTGGNEGHARRELYNFMRNSIIELDGSRPFIPSSSGFARLPEGWPGAWPDNLPTGVYSGGPYTWQDPKSYYARAIAGRDWVFKDETGLPSMVTWDILPKVIPNLVWDKKLPFPLNNSWGYHDAATGNGRWDLYYSEMVKRYGEARSMEEFCDKMQLMNATWYQGIFEAAGHKLNDIGGVMLWKLNAAFPSVVWQVYDWYLQTNAGYYFMQNACEPLHIQMNLSNHKVMVINRRYKPAVDLNVSAEVFDIDTKSIFREETTVSLGTSEVSEAISLEKVLKEAAGVSFVVLNLKDQAGKVVSHNVYWLANDDNFKSLNIMPPAAVDASVVSRNKEKGFPEWTLKVTNNSDKLAFFIRPRLMAGDEEILPSFWTGSYFSLAPGESTTVTVSCPEAEIRNRETSITVGGWNVNEITAKAVK